MEHIKEGEHVAVDFGHAGKFGSAKIEAVKKGINGRVCCDLSIKTSYEPPEFTKISDVDSRFIISRQDWLDINQKDYKPETITTKTPMDLRQRFESAAVHMIRHLCEDWHPHATAIITPTSAEIMSGEMSTGQILDYVRD